MEHELYWIMHSASCPFDDTALGKKKQIFKGKSGTLRLPIWICPLCERKYIKYEKHEDLIRNYPQIKCRFLDMKSSVLDARKRLEERERIKSGVFEPSAEQLKKYKYLLQHYYADEKSFCECFSEKPTLFQFFAQYYSMKEASGQHFRKAADDPQVHLVARFLIRQYNKNEEEKERAENIQAFFIDNYFDDGIPYRLDEEQSLAVAVNDPRVLAAARAGSGKTRTIVAKVVYLLDHEHVPASNILSLAFNNSVPKKINKKVNELLQSRKPRDGEPIEIAKTFHSLAHQIVAPRKVLFGKERTQFIQKIIEELKETKPGFKESVYNSFRQESLNLNKKQFSNIESFYSALRNAQYETLNGEIVKSAGEKWIADYFYEHNIHYVYEPCFYPRYISAENISGTQEDCFSCMSFLDRQSIRRPNGKRVRKAVKPDFLLIDYSYVWEHWGIDEGDPNRYKGQTEHFEMSWSDYHQLMSWKRNFWNSDWRKNLRVKKLQFLGRRTPEQQVERIKNIRALVESSVAEMDGGREAFEKIIDSKMELLGVPHAIRNHDELVEEVWNKQIRRFTAMMESFIDKYEQHYPSKSYSEFIKDMDAYSKPERVSIFLTLGLTVLKRYHEVLKSPQKPVEYKEYADYSHDFNQLIAEAAQIIEQGKADSELLNYQYLFVDEYQDFSELFYQFINAVLSRKPGMHLFCVGDVWQAINRFMGADTCYFDDFSKYYSDARILQIRTNYRSSKRIVELSNCFMHNCGFEDSPAIATQTELGPQCFHLDVGDSFIALTDDYPDYESDHKIVTLLSEKHFSRETALYLKKSLKVIQENQGSSIFLLTRTNEFAHYDISYLQNRIRDYIMKELSFSKEEADLVEVMTMHKSKGLEADIVIVLEANKGNIPKVHPDNDLYLVFGETQEKLFVDEERLFYVAITRAKKQFWILYDGEPSVFVSQLKNQN